MNSVINTVMGFADKHGTPIILILSAATALLIVLNLCLYVKLGKLTKGRKLATPVDGLSQEYVDELARRLGNTEFRTSELGERLNGLDTRLGQSVQNVGLVRFDAFDDIGGEQSFALALLDRDMSGVVISSIYSRTECRTYAKKISSGQSQHVLSDEERKAISKAETSLRC